ncbi:hypothetical protein HYV49_01980 [Candidatus Pacearchaeota archaeon]|nr:hypothetical protein [Candidatus Pacearchaeota archaeon]
MASICQICNRSFDSEEALSQHAQAKHSSPVKKTNFRKYAIVSLIILIGIFSVASVFSYMKKPGDYDAFAKCLAEKGAVVYGNDFCQYTAKQLNFFGNSKQYLNYVKCSENKELCDRKGIGVTPTWEINNEFYPQVQTFERLSAISGCEF